MHYGELNYNSLTHIQALRRVDVAGNPLVLTAHFRSLIHRERRRRVIEGLDAEVGRVTRCFHISFSIRRNLDRYYILHIVVMSKLPHSLFS